MSRFGVVARTAAGFMVIASLFSFAQQGRSEGERLRRQLLADVVLSLYIRTVVLCNQPSFLHAPFVPLLDVNLIGPGT